MADEKGYIDTDKLAKFTPTMELRFEHRLIPYLLKEQVFKEFLQQKWTNELGDEQWRDIPLVISDK